MCVRLTGAVSRYFSDIAVAGRSAAQYDGDCGGYLNRHVFCSVLKGTEINLNVPHTPRTQLQHARTCTSTYKYHLYHPVNEWSPPIGQVPKVESPKQLTTLSLLLTASHSSQDCGGDQPGFLVLRLATATGFSTKKSPRDPDFETPPVIRECFVLPQPLTRAAESRCHRHHLFVLPLDALSP